MKVSRKQLLFQDRRIFMYQFEMKPFRTSQWDREVEKIFDAFTKTNTFTPACEILDEEKHFCISMDIPGLSKEEIDIEVKDNQLHVSGERKTEERNEKTNVLRTEKRYGKFSRVFNLPQNINSEAIQARFENGVLEIALPKEEKAQTRKISISGWDRDVVSTDLKN